MGSVRYFSTMLAAKSVHISDDEPITKHHWAMNHCRLEGANGEQIITLPIEKPDFGAKTMMRDIVISTHGNWERIHWGAIFSAYGKSPFFEYIEDDLNRIYSNHSKWLVDFNNELRELVINFLDLPIVMDVTGSDAALSLQRQVGEKKSDSLPINDVPYYQLWASRYGFKPDMSILDLLMNTGRESIITLQKMMAKD